MICSICLSPMIEEITSDEQGIIFRCTNEISHPDTMECDFYKKRLKWDEETDRFMKKYPIKQKGVVNEYADNQDSR